MGPYLFLLEHLFCLSRCKTHWTMLVDDVGCKICRLIGDLKLHGHSAIFPLCKPKLSRDEFIRWSQILQGLQMASRSTVQTTPKCIQVQPVTCCDLLAFLHEFELYSLDSCIDSFVMIGNLSWSLELQPVIS